MKQKLKVLSQLNSNRIDSIGIDIIAQHTAISYDNDAGATKDLLNKQQTYILVPCYFCDLIYRKRIEPIYIYIYPVIKILSE